MKEVKFISLSVQVRDASKVEHIRTRFRELADKLWDEGCVTDDSCVENHQTDPENYVHPSST